MPSPDISNRTGSACSQVPSCNSPPNPNHVSGALANVVASDRPSANSSSLCQSSNVGTVDVATNPSSLYATRRSKAAKRVFWVANLGAKPGSTSPRLDRSEDGIIARSYRLQTSYEIYPRNSGERPRN